MHGHAQAPPWAMRYPMRIMAMGGRGRRRGWGWVDFPGHFAMGGKGPFSASRTRVSRGEVRTAILLLLAEEPMHGYQIMQELSERSGGVWRPSPGSIYPTLQQLADEGLVELEDRDGKKIYNLTDTGRAKVEGSDATPPWQRFDGEGDDELMALRDLGFQVGAAVMQVAHAGSQEQQAEARTILADTRKRLYRLLAEDE
ncbi:MAG: PadR family transcriptional regulator [Acidimicrobiia bacterium]|nr:MAG: PadR family transcriptional regulator [Acidimicrobiia bacterium]